MPVAGLEEKTWFQGDPDKRQFTVHRHRIRYKTVGMFTVPVESPFYCCPDFCCAWVPARRIGLKERWGVGCDREPVEEYLHPEHIRGVFQPSTLQCNTGLWPCTLANPRRWDGQVGATPQEAFFGVQDEELIIGEDLAAKARSAQLLALLANLIFGTITVCFVLFARDGRLGKWLFRWFVEKGKQCWKNTPFVVLWDMGVFILPENETGFMLVFSFCQNVLGNKKRPKGLASKFVPKQMCPLRRPGGEALC